MDIHPRTKGQTMKWLLWREYRRNRLLLGMGAVLLSFPICSSSFGTRGLRDEPPITGKSSRWRQRAAYFFRRLTCALLGGNAIAGERSDRSAEFMAYLPVSRLRRLISKCDFDHSRHRLNLGDEPFDSVDLRIRSFARHWFILVECSP